jgi:hypothetical protein
MEVHDFSGLRHGGPKPILSLFGAMGKPCEGRITISDHHKIYIYVYDHHNIDHHMSSYILRLYFQTPYVRCADEYGLLFQICMMYIDKCKYLKNINDDFGIVVSDMSMTNPPQQCENETQCFDLEPLAHGKMNLCHGNSRGY